MSAPCPNEWHESDKAQQLLRELDAAERMADRWYRWSDVSRAFGERAADIESELDNLRQDSIAAFANASGFSIYSEGWWEADDEAEAEAPTVAQVMADARRMRLGDQLLQEAA
jgi:GNAT superfamily N-acetyltransferase